MNKRLTLITTLFLGGAALAACQSDGQGGSTAGAPSASSSGSNASSTGSTGAAPSTGSTGAAAAPRPTSSIPNLINVNLQDVLNDLSVRLNIDRANVPVTIQLPISLAANVCGVSVNVLSGSLASGRGTCTATTAPQELAQVVQQQMAAGGSVGGGAQGGSTAATGAASNTAGTSSGGASSTGGTSTGSSNQ